MQIKLGFFVENPYWNDSSSFFIVLGIKDSLSFVLDKTKDLMSAVNGLENEPKGSTNSTTGWDN